MVETVGLENRSTPLFFNDLSCGKHDIYGVTCNKLATEFATPDRPKQPVENPKKQVTEQGEVGIKNKWATEVQG